MFSLNPLACLFSPLAAQSERNILEGSCEWLPDRKSVFSLNPLACSFSPVAGQSGRNMLPATKSVLLTDNSTIPQTDSLDAESSLLNPTASSFSPLAAQSGRNMLPATKFVLLTDSSRMPQTESLDANVKGENSQTCLNL